MQSPQLSAFAIQHYLNKDVARLLSTE